MFSLYFPIRRFLSGCMETMRLHNPVELWRSMLKADPLVAIADAAQECGFHHLGNFAAD